MPRGVWGSISGRKRPLDSSLQQPWDLFIQIHLIDFSMTYKGGVAESGGNGSIIYFYAVLLTTKMVKVLLFQIPSFKFKTKASGVYSHPNSAPHAPLMLTNHKVYIYSFLNSVHCNGLTYHSHERLLPLRNWTEKRVIFSNTRVCGGKKIGIRIFKNVCAFP